MKEGQVVICTENHLRFFFLWLMIKSSHYDFTGTQISQKGLLMISPVYLSKIGL